MASRYPALAFAIAFVNFCSAQFTPGSEAYQAWKLTQVQHPQPGVHTPVFHEHAGGQRDNEPCACWIEPDSSYTLALAPNDDGSSPSIQLPFAFSLYGEQFTSCYVNNNGNISFGSAYGTYSSSAFPNADFQMLAPYWADVDTRTDSAGSSGGEVEYKLTPHALYVNWSAVGYYNTHNDLLNSFQLIISDGTDPAISGGNNVSFCYGAMEWTTGDASQGVGGLGGVPATVGANRGDGIDYLQFGRFNHDSTDWNGPYADTSGVAWLTDRHFSFSTSDATIPPIYTSIGCDTLVIEAGSSYDYPMMVLAGGIGQVVSATSQCNGIAGYVESQNISGAAAQIVSTITPTASEVGMHTINYMAQNDAATPSVSTYTMYVKVLDATTGIHVATSPSTLSVQPNPAMDRATITWPIGQQPVRVEVFAMNGAVVLAQAPGTGATQMELDLSGLPDGIYTVRATGAASTSTVRLVRSSAR